MVRAERESQRLARLRQAQSALAKLGATIECVGAAANEDWIYVVTRDGAEVYEESPDPLLAALEALADLLQEVG